MSFLTAEELERVLLSRLMKQIGVKDYEFSEIGSFAGWDVKFAGWKAEAKVRKEHKEDQTFALPKKDFWDEDEKPIFGYMLEKKKFDALLEDCEKALYINFFPIPGGGCWVKIFLIKKASPPEWGVKFANKSTMGDSGKIQKQVAMLTTPIYDKELV